MEKAPLLKWISMANGTGNLAYYKKAKKIARIIQVLYIFFGIVTRSH